MMMLMKSNNASVPEISILFGRARVYVCVCVCVCAVAAAGAPGVSGVSSRTQSEDDSGEETGTPTIWSLQRGGGPQSPEVAV